MLLIMLHQDFHILLNSVQVAIMLGNITEMNLGVNINLIKNSQAVKKGAAPKKAMMKKDVKSKVAAKKWL